jgi:hypothetical protein
LPIELELEAAAPIDTQPEAPVRSQHCLCALFVGVVCD